MTSCNSRGSMPVATPPRCSQYSRSSVARLPVAAGANGQPRSRRHWRPGRPPPSAAPQTRWHIRCSGCCGSASGAAAREPPPRRRRPAPRPARARRRRWCRPARSRPDRHRRNWRECRARCRVPPRPRTGSSRRRRRRRRWSASPQAATLTSSGVDTAVIAGVTTSGCIRATATDALQYGFRPLVVRDACADRKAAYLDSNLRDLDAK